MDIYGYHSYQYNHNQNDELTKQMYAQQALASSLSCNRGVAEAHAMPVPTGMPWNAEGLPWGMPSPPSLVQFTALPPPEAKVPPVVHCKRKSLDLEPAIPAKQLITEEKMAAHLSGLHISSNYTPHTLSSDELMEVAMETPSTSTAITEKLKGHTIVLSEEVKKLRDEPLLPAALIERFEKPRMSLVVWKPKDDILEKIREVVDENDKPKSEQETTTRTRNGVLVPEMSGMDVEM